MKGLQKALQGSQPTLMAELSLRHETDAEELLRQAHVLKGSVDSIQVSENPYAWVQMSPLAAAELLLRDEIDPTVRLHCRDRNRIALKSDLLGLKALGVQGLVLNRGSRIPEDHELRGKAVFDVSCREFIAMAGELNSDDHRPAGEELVLGTGVRVFAPPADWDAELLLTRAGDHVRFLQTQLCMDTGLLRSYMRRLVEKKVTWKCAVLVTVGPLPSVESARWLEENSPGAVIPPAVVKRLESAPDPEKEGIAVCSELMQAMAEIPGVSGFNILTFGHPGSVVASVSDAGLILNRSPA